MTEKVIVLLALVFLFICLVIRAIEEFIKGKFYLYVAYFIAAVLMAGSIYNVL